MNVQNIQEKVLVLDDDQTALQLIKYLLNKWFPDALVEIADNIKIAYDMAASEEYSLIITDWTIDKKGDGVEFISMLRSQGIEIPVIILTGLPETVEKIVKEQYEVYDKSNGGLAKLKEKIVPYLILNNMNRRVTGLINLANNYFNEPNGHARTNISFNPGH